MPVITPMIKINAVKNWGGEYNIYLKAIFKKLYITIKLVGNNFDEAQRASFEYQV